MRRQWLIQPLVRVNLPSWRLDDEPAAWFQPGRHVHGDTGAGCGRGAPSGCGLRRGPRLGFGPGCRCGSSVGSARARPPTTRKSCGRCRHAHPGPQPIQHDVEVFPPTVQRAWPRGYHEAGGARLRGVGRIGAVPAPMTEFRVRLLLMVIGWSGTSWLARSSVGGLCNGDW
jgi:hypothetical protein